MNGSDDLSHNPNRHIIFSIAQYLSWSLAFLAENIREESGGYPACTSLDEVDGCSGDLGVDHVGNIRHPSSPAVFWKAS